MPGLPLPTSPERPTTATWVSLVTGGAYLSSAVGFVTALVAILLGSWPFGAVGLWLMAAGLVVTVLLDNKDNRERAARDTELQAFADELARHYDLTYVTRPDLSADASNTPARPQLITVRRNADDVTQNVVVTCSRGRVTFVGPTDDLCEYPAASAHVTA